MLITSPQTATDWPSMIGGTHAIAARSEFALQGISRNCLQMRFVSVLLAMAGPLTSTGIVDLAVITRHGWVRHSVSTDWLVGAVQTKPPKTVAGYQIPNPADEGTPDSTNVSFITIQKEDRDSVAEFTKYVSRQLGADAPTQVRRNGWVIWSQKAKQAQTIYSVRDAYKDIADVRIFVRMAWPHLPANPKEYNSEMERVFGWLLDSVEGGLGPYPARKGEIFRRPIR